MSFDTKNCIGVAVLVSPPVDELDESGLSDTEIVGIVHSHNREAAYSNLLDLVDEYVADHGVIPEGQEIKLHFTTDIQYCG